MSDLSRLLDDVYRSGNPAPGPSWASDSALDEVFADWVPGPPADAPEAERAYANTPDAAQELAAALEVDDEPVRAEVDADPFAPLQALLDEAIRRAPDVEVPEPEPVAEPEHDLVVVDEPVVLADPEPDPAFVPPTPVPGWSRADDDILPAAKVRRGLLRRR